VRGFFYRLVRLLSFGGSMKRQSLIPSVITEEEAIKLCSGGEWITDLKIKDMVAVWATIEREPKVTGMVPCKLG